MSETKQANDIEKLRGILFTALENLQDGKIDVPKAKAISDVSQTIINSAKVELDFNKGKGSQFFKDGNAMPDSSNHNVHKIGNRTVYEMK
jgi:endo-beta-N-acetylglucosaminidase D